MGQNLTYTLDAEALIASATKHGSGRAVSSASQLKLGGYLLDINICRAERLVHELAHHALLRHKFNGALYPGALYDLQSATMSLVYSEMKRLSPTNSDIHEAATCAVTYRVLAKVASTPKLRDILLKLGYHNRFRPETTMGSSEAHFLAVSRRMVMMKRLNPVVRAITSYLEEQGVLVPLAPRPRPNRRKNAHGRSNQDATA